MTVLKKEDFPDILSKNFLRVIGKDREGRPILYFYIKNFTPEGTTPDRLGLYMGIVVSEALDS